MILKLHADQTLTRKSPWKMDGWCITYTGRCTDTTALGIMLQRCTDKGRRHCSFRRTASDILSHCILAETFRMKNMH